MTFTLDEIISTLHEADGYLSLIGYRYKDKVGSELAEELQQASGRCRELVKRIEEGE